jgi:hypothetical protein
VLLKIACLLMRWSLGLAVLAVRGDGEKNAELLVCVPRISSAAPASRVASSVLLP